MRYIFGTYILYLLCLFIFTSEFMKKRKRQKVTCIRSYYGEEFKNKFAFLCANIEKKRYQTSLFISSHIV